MHAKGWCLQADRGVYRKESRNMEDDLRRGGMDVCLSLTSRVSSVLDDAGAS